MKFNKGDLVKVSDTMNNNYPNSYTNEQYPGLFELWKGHILKVVGCAKYEEGLIYRLETPESQFSAYECDLELIYSG